MEKTWEGALRTFPPPTVTLRCMETWRWQTSLGRRLSFLPLSACLECLSYGLTSCHEICLSSPASICRSSCPTGCGTFQSVPDSGPGSCQGCCDLGLRDPVSLSDLCPDDSTLSACLCVFPCLPSVLESWYLEIKFTHYGILLWNIHLCVRSIIINAIYYKLYRRLCLLLETYLFWVSIRPDWKSKSCMENVIQLN